jgi:hypothetical protein
MDDKIQMMKGDPLSYFATLWKKQRPHHLPDAPYQEYSP